MSHIKKVFVSTVLMLIATVHLVGAQEQSIIDILTNDGRFDTFLVAIVAAELDDDLSSGEWTVFAPTDDAFEKIGLDADNIATEMGNDVLTDILLYHIMTGTVSTAEAKTMLGDITMANGRVAGLKYFDNSLWINDDSRVIDENIVATNGTIHVVNNVILPQWPRDTGSRILFENVFSENSSPYVNDDVILELWSQGGDSDNEDECPECNIIEDVCAELCGCTGPLCLPPLGCDCGNVQQTADEIEDASTVNSDDPILDLLSQGGDSDNEDDCPECSIIEDVCAELCGCTGLLCLPPIGCDCGNVQQTTGEDDGLSFATSDDSIAAILSQDEGFSTITALMVATGLDSTLSNGEYTVFAPTDAAFAKWNLDAKKIKNMENADQTNLLLNHVLLGSVSSAEAKTMLGDMTMANGQIAGLKYFDGSLWTNDFSRVIIENVIGNNGTIHVVDNIMVGPWPLGTSTDSPLYDCPTCTPPEDWCSFYCWPGCTSCGGPIIEPFNE